MKILKNNTLQLTIVFLYSIGSSLYGRERIPITHNQLAWSLQHFNQFNLEDEG